MFRDSLRDQLIPWFFLAGALGEELLQCRSSGESLTFRDLADLSLSGQVMAQALSEPLDSENALRVKLIPDRRTADPR